MAQLNVNVGALQLQNPVLTASGTFGYGLEFADLIDLNRLGGFIVKGTTLLPREGNDYPRMAETPQGMLNCVGLQNKGVDYFAEHIYPQIKDYRTNILVNVSGHSPEDYARCAERVAALDGIPGIGKVRAQALLKTFKSVKAIREADIFALERVLPKDAAASVYLHFHGETNGKSQDR